MATSMLKIESPAATGIKVTDECLSAELADGRTISVPLKWFPRLVHATLEERENWDLSDDGAHVHWPDLDEDISVEGLIAGWPSRETKESLRSLARSEEGRSPPGALRTGSLHGLRRRLGDAYPARATAAAPSKPASSPRVLVRMGVLEAGP